MAQNYSFIDDTTTEGQNTIASMKENGASYGIGISEGINISGISTFAESVEFKGTIKDGEDTPSVGTSGQILSSTVTGVKWIDAGTLAAGAASQVAVNSNNTDADQFLSFVGGTSSNHAIRVNSNVKVNPSDGSVNVNKLTTENDTIVKGKLGIGNDSPSKELDLLDETNQVDIRLKTTADSFNSFIFDSNRGADLQYALIDGNWDGTVVNRIRFVTGTNGTDKDDGWMAFHTKETGQTLAERLRITSKGITVTGICTAPTFKGLNSITGQSDNAANESRTPGTYTFTDLTGSGNGSGAGFTVTIANDGNNTVSLVRTAGGMNFAVDETLTLTGASIGGGSNIVITVTSIASAVYHGDGSNLTGLDPYSDFTASTASNQGTRGTVPAPPIGAQVDRFLKADGNWVVPSYPTIPGAPTTDAAGLVPQLPTDGATPANPITNQFLKSDGTWDSAQVKSDWNQATTTDLSFIDNKPDVLKFKTFKIRVSAGAVENTNFFNIVADDDEDTFEIVQGSNVTLTADTTNDKLTIDAANDNTTYSIETADNGTGVDINLNDGTSDDTITVTKGVNVTLTPDGSGTGFEIASSDTTYGAPSTSDPGLVPALPTGDATKVLKSDGQWGTDANTQRGIDDTPVDGETAESITSNWAFNHNAATGNGAHVPTQGYVHSVTVNTAGSGYAVNDVITISGGTTGATFKVDTISGGGATGPVATISPLLTSGSGYSATADDVGTTGGSGNNLTVDYTAKGHTGEFLKYDGTWATPSYTTNTNTTYDLEGGGTDGATGTFGSGVGKIILVPNTGTNDEVSITGGSNIRIDGTGTSGFTITAQDTTASVLGGADGTNAGSAGLAPAPAAADNVKFLRGDSTWSDISATTVTLADESGNSADQSCFLVFSKDATGTEKSLHTNSDLKIDAKESTISASKFIVDPSSSAFLKADGSLDTSTYLTSQGSGTTYTFEATSPAGGATTRENIKITPGGAGAGGSDQFIGFIAGDNIDISSNESDDTITYSLSDSICVGSSDSTIADNGRIVAHISTNKNVAFNGSQSEVGDVPALVAFKDNGSLTDIGFRGETLRFASTNKERLRISSTGIAVNGSIKHIEYIATFTDSGTDNSRTDGSYSFSSLNGNLGGVNAAFTVLEDGNGLTVTMQDGGTGFVVGETITILDSSLGNGGGASLVITVATITTNSVEYYGDGSNLTSLPAGQLTGTVADARISTLTASKLSGALPAISGANLTGFTATQIPNLNADKINAGTFAVARIPAIDKIEEGDTSVEVADSGTDGHIKLTVEGSERLKIDSEGKTFIKRTVSSTTGNHPALEIETICSGTEDTNFATGIDFKVDGVHKKRLAVTDGTGEGGGDWIFYRDQGNNEALRITSDGVLYLGPHKTSTAADNVPYEIRVAPYGWGQSQDIAAISMGNHSGATGNDDGEIVFKTGKDVHTDANGLKERLRIDSDGSVGIGIQDPMDILHLHKGGDGVTNVGMILTHSTSGDSSSSDDGIHMYLSGTAASIDNFEGGGVTIRPEGASNGNVTITTTGTTFQSSVTASSLVKSGGAASEFLKADGSVDSTSYSNTSHTHTYQTPLSFSTGISESGGTVTVDSAVTTTITLSGGTTAQTVSTVALNAFNALEYTMYISHSTGIQAQKLLVMCDGTNHHHTEYAVMYSASVLGTFSTSTSGSNVLVKFTPANSGTTTVKFIKQVVA